MNMNAIVEFFNQIPSLGWAGIVVWFVIAFSNSNDRDNFMENTWKLITSPSELGDYSEKTLTNIEQGFTAALVTPVASILGWLISVGRGIWENLQWKLIGQLVMLAFLPLFFVADAIAISSVLDTLGFTLGLPVERLPEHILDLLGQFGIAVAAGTFFSVIVSGFVMFEVFGSSEFSDYGNYPEPLKRIVKILAVLVMVVSLVSGIALGFQAWKAQGTLPAWLNGVDAFVLFSLNVLVRANVLIATALILLEALKGLRSLLLVLIGAAILVTGIFFIFVGVVGSLGRIAIDWLIRSFRWLLWLISFLVFKPLDIITSAPKDFIVFIVNLFRKNEKNEKNEPIESQELHILP
jgi:hypothetical protein